MRTAGFLVVAAALAFGCGNKSSDSSEKAATKKPAADRTYTADEVTKAANNAFRKTLAARGEEDKMAKWRPAEFKSGRGRWRDAATYVDGVPVGMFWHGELPSTQKPVWVEQIEGLDFRAGDTGPRERIEMVRRYRFSDYFEGVGVDLKKINEIHFYGPNKGILRVTGEEFRRVKDFFYFRFGLGTEGKAIAVVPKDLGANFDRLMGVCIYIDKKPPEIREEGAFFAGKRVRGVPYFGAPIRGGIRVYHDDRLATRFKRNKMDRKLGVEAGDGVVRYKLMEVLKAQGVKTDKIVQLEVIYDERRQQRFDRAEIAEMTMLVSSQGRGEILLNDVIPANSLAFYSVPLPTKTASNGATPH